MGSERMPAGGSPASGKEIPVWIRGGVPIFGKAVRTGSTVRVLKSTDDVENTLCKGLYHLMQHPNYVKSLTNFPFMIVTL